MSAQWVALLGMAGTAFAFVVTASVFVIRKSIALGRLIERFENFEKRVGRLERVTFGEAHVSQGDYQ